MSAVTGSSAGSGEIVTGSGSDGVVRIYAADGTLRASFLASDPTNLSGLFVG